MAPKEQSELLAQPVHKVHKVLPALRAHKAPKALPV